MPQRNPFAAFAIGTALMILGATGLGLTIVVILFFKWAHEVH
jgi:hypothetical protein